MSSGETAVYSIRLYVHHTEVHQPKSGLPMRWPHMSAAVWQLARRAIRVVASSGESLPLAVCSQTDSASPNVESGGQSQKLCCHQSRPNIELMWWITSSEVVAAEDCTYTDVSASSNSGNRVLDASADVEESGKRKEGGCTR